MAGNRKLAIEIAGDARGGQTALQQVGAGTDTMAAKAESSSKRISGAFGSMFGQLNQAGVLGPIAAQIDTVQRSLDMLDKRGSTVGTKLLAGGGVALGAGAGLSAVASKDIQAQESLKAAIEQTNGTWSDYKDRVEEVANAQVGFGHSDDEVNQALATLTLSFGDAGKAADQMQLVADLAAKKQVSLAEAATMVAKAHGGAGRLFKEFNITVADNADGTKNYDGALDQLSQKLNGQAAAAVSGFTGHLKVATTWVENQVSAIGQKYGPALMGLGAVTSGVGAILETGGAIMRRFKTGQEAAAVATDVLTVSTEAETVAMDEAAISEGVALGPILLIIAAIALLVAGVIYAYQNWDWFRTAVDAVASFLTGTLWPALQTGIAALVSSAQWLWSTMQSVWSGISDVISAAWDNVISPYLGFIGTEVGVVQSVIGALQAAWSTAWDAIGNALQSVWDHVISPVVDKVEGAIGVIQSGVDTVKSWLGISDVSGSLGPNLTGQQSSHRVGANAAGTDYWPGGLSWVGERGPELLNLPRGSQIIPNGRSMAMAGGNSYTIINHNGPGVNPAEVGRATVEAIRSYERTNGTGWRN